MKKAYLLGGVALLLLALAGCPTPDDKDGNEHKDTEMLSLTVTGIPANAGIVAATLFDDSLLTGGRTPLAVGINVGGVFGFVEYVPTSPSKMGDPWIMTGSYYVVLADSIDETKAKSYVYTNGGTAPVKYTFNNTRDTHSIAWDLFKLNPDSSNQSDSQLVLTVTGITGATIVAASLLDDSWNPVAAGTNVGGVFNFLDYPAMEDVFTTLGSYNIILATNITGAGDNYVYTAGGAAPATYTFNTTTATIAWDQFAKQGGEASDDQLQLTVTGIPTGTTIAVATLMNGSTPVAFGMNDSGVFNFMTTDQTASFTTKGSYYIYLAEKASQSDPGIMYYYKASGTTPAEYLFNTTTATIAWDQFAKQTAP